MHGNSLWRPSWTVPDMKYDPQSDAGTTASHQPPAPPHNEGFKQMSNKRSICLRNRRDWLGRKLCACGCIRLVPKERINWATDDCYDRANPSAMRRRVWQRDKGICSTCGVDCEKMLCYALRARPWKTSPHSGELRFREGGKFHGAFLRPRYNRAVIIHRRWAIRLGTASANRLTRLKSLGWPGDLNRSWWDADHIKPVVEGGGLCGLENYRTLCVPCHKKESAALAARRAEKRKIVRQPEFTLIG